MSDIQTITNGIKIDLSKFAILARHEGYIARKKCSITGETYEVALTFEEMRKYYQKDGKHMDNLMYLSDEDKTFLLSTCTPAEVKSLSEEVKANLDLKLWRSQLGIKDK